MAYVYITWLADILRAEGCIVKEESGWKTRGRPSNTGDFAPKGVLWHHTGTTASTSNPCPSLRICTYGRPDLPGPLCQGLIGYDGVIHVIAAGRANHAGTAKSSGPMPAGDGNEMYVGFEIDYNGTQKMSTAQYDAAIKAGAAIVRKLAKSANTCRGHKETSVTGKWDPGQVDLNTMRSQVNTRLGSSTGGGDDWLAEPKDVWAVKWGASDQSAMNFIDSLDELSSQKTWTNKPWASADPPSAGVALQRIYSWVQDINSRLTEIEKKLG
jgi:hypothetical protein